MTTDFVSQDSVVVEEEVKTVSKIIDGMRVTSENPPEHILSMIQANGMHPTITTVFTVGDTIYVPSGNLNLEYHLVAHEKVHCIQQGNDPEGWWARYVEDQYFRIEQEVEAYAAQYRAICKNVLDRNQRSKVLFDLAGYLASPIYGSVIGRSDARMMIKNKANVK